MLKKTQNLSESIFLRNSIFINSLVFIKGEFLYKVRTKSHNKITWHDNTCFNALIQSIWFKTKNREKRKPKETVENADLHKAVLNNAMNMLNFIAKNKLQIISRDKSRDASYATFKNVFEKILSKAS